MRVLNKEISTILEQYGGAFFCIVIAVLFYFFTNINLLDYRIFIQEFPTIGMCIFGFLLTLLAIIIQGDSKTITWLKSRKFLYSQFIKFNKRVVLLSLIASISSYIIGYISWKFLPSRWIAIDFERFTLCILLGLMIWLLIDTLLFIRIFYTLIKE